MTPTKKKTLDLREGDLHGHVAEHAYMSMSSLKLSPSYYFACIERAVPRKYYNPQVHSKPYEFHQAWDGAGPDRLTAEEAEKDLPALFEKHVKYFKEHGVHLDEVRRQEWEEKRKARKAARLAAKSV